MKRTFTKGYGKYGIFFRRHKILDYHDVFWDDSGTCHKQYKMSDDDKWLAKQEDWKSLLNFVETRKNRKQVW